MGHLVDMSQCERRSSKVESSLLAHEKFNRPLRKILGNTKVFMSTDCAQTITRHSPNLPYCWQILRWKSCPRAYRKGEPNIWGSINRAPLPVRPVPILSWSTVAAAQLAGNHHAKWAFISCPAIQGVNVVHFGQLVQNLSQKLLIFRDGENSGPKFASSSRLWNSRSSQFECQPWWQKSI